MTIDAIEEQLRAALSERASHVPVEATARVRRAVYPVKSHRSVRALATVGAVAAVAGWGIYLASRPAASSPAPVVPSTPLAYVGASPRLAVTWLPAGFKVGRAIPVPQGDGGLSSFGQLPSRSFVSQTGDQSIVLEEGLNGEGPVDKLTAFAKAHPDVTSTQLVNGTTVTIVDLASAGAGDGYVLSWQVSANSWALLGGSAGVTVQQLLQIVEGIQS